MDWGALPTAHGHFGSEDSPHLSQALQPSSRLRGLLGAHHHALGARGLLAGPSWARLAGDKGRGAAHLQPPKAFLSHLLATPAPAPAMPSLVPASSLSPLLDLFTLSSSPTSPSQISTSVRRMASSVGLARCASIPVAATSVWTRHVLPPTGRAPAQGEAERAGAGVGVNWKWGGVLSSGSWAAGTVAPVWPGPFSRPCVRQTHGVHPA